MNAIRLIVALLLTFVLSTASAQPSELPLIVVMKGDLYRWDEGDLSLYPLSNWRYNSEVSLSPDGSEVVYHSYARVTVEAINRTGGFGGGKGPGNIWVLDPATGDGTRLIDQPADAVFLSDNGQDNAIIRSKPFWSPDGTKAGWTEIQYPSANAVPSLWVYDFTSATAQKVTDLPIHQSVNGIYDGFWTDGGIVLDGVMWSSETGELEYNYPVYSENGDLLNEISLLEDDTVDPKVVIPVQHQGQNYLAAYYVYSDDSAPEWMLYDLLTGESFLAPNEPRGYSAFAEEDSLYLTHMPQFSGYYAFNSHGEQLDLSVPEGVDLVDAALSPDGQAIAYRTFDVPESSSSIVYVWRDGKTTLVPGTQESNFIEDLLWSPIVWRVE